MAHLEVWKQQKSMGEPHGNLWKKTFAAMMIPLLENDIFPTDLKQTLQNHLKNPRATTGDKHLTVVLHNYDQRKVTLVQDIPENSLFAINGRVFRKFHKARTHYHCQCLVSKKKYRINGLAEVTPVQEK